jgi:aspartyl-tRNA(Asn)/glutamyl-tRNA(Gln) amidotransferase subunit B
MHYNLGFPMQFEPVIGLEVHAQLDTATKIFCGCSTRFGTEPNHNTCPVCLGLPGALPVLNAKAVELALRAALAVHCTIPPSSIFARKNYFYPDLPKGYQISQYDQPLAVDGFITLPMDNASSKIRIKRIHMEEDAGKLLHEGVESGSNGSYVDLNRSGVPLIEIVSEPDIRMPAEAYSYLTQLKAILRYCEVSQANMEEGNLRCDANISIRPKGAPGLGTKVEIKNLNSFRNVVRALEYEIERQTAALKAGTTVTQETRLFNANKGATEPMRSKEEAHDYRYFPDPDLPVLQIEQEQIESIRRSLPELPEEKRARFAAEYSLPPSDVEVLTEERALADFFEETAQKSGRPKLAANWILRDLLARLKESGKPVAEAPISAGHLADLIRLLHSGSINANQAKAVFEEMWISGSPAEEIVKQKGMQQISGESEVGRYIDAVFADNPELIERYKKGETKLLGVLVGLVMKASGGKTNPALANRLVREKLS